MDATRFFDADEFAAFQNAAKLTPKPIKGFPIRRSR
jgi:hypothetical protein